MRFELDDKYHSLSLAKGFEGMCPRLLKLNSSCFTGGRHVWGLGAGLYLYMHHLVINGFDLSKCIYY